MSILRHRYASAALAGTAGAVDGYALAATSHYSSHMSGTTSQLAGAIARGDIALLALLILVLVAFSTGAVLSGIIIASPLGRDRHRCVATLLGLETLLILIAIIPARSDPTASTSATAWLLATLAGSMGLQNSIGARFLRHHQRTTHVTGTLTDVGYYIGRTLWDRFEEGHALAVDHGKLVVLGRTFGCFLLGGIGCRLLATGVGSWALVTPAAIVGCLAVLGILRRDPPDPAKLD